MLEPGRGREVRFDFRAGAGRQPARRRSASTREAGGDADAVAVGAAGAARLTTRRRSPWPACCTTRATAELDAAGGRRSRALDPAPQPRDARRWR